MPHSLALPLSPSLAHNPSIPPLFFLLDYRLSRNLESLPTPYDSPITNEPSAITQADVAPVIVRPRQIYYAFSSQI